ncbi:unnamed protein product [Gongylonema pulchrum]|uniref:CoA transferase n=1 Tax=Gongylonema pulchrum TaxID=637853 RepID=A0A183E491_9BILA|nr:unnamed protein product [Gongylonema pulchrum]
MHVNSCASGNPHQVAVALIDMITGLYAHGAILTALLQRNQTGKGQKVECNLLATQMAALLNVASNYLNAGVLDCSEAVQRESILPCQAFRTKDQRYFVVAVGSDSGFKKVRN